MPPDTDAANAEALRRTSSAKPFLIDVRRAGDLIAGLGEHELLHAGPPLAGWHEACGALRGAVIGSIVHFGIASDLASAEEAVAGGTIVLSAANDRNALATYGGVIGRDTPVLVVENRSGNAVACAALNEGRGRALRYGANDPETLSRLAWLEGEFAQMLGAALRLSGGISVFELLGQALHMGDDGHSRQKAASALFLNAVAPWLVESRPEPRALGRALRFMGENDIFFLPITMAAAKSALVSAEGIAGCTVVTCMCTNGVRFGIKVSGAANQWFTAPIPAIDGRYFEGFGAADANPVIGDSEIAETLGLGAFAMPAAPALARYVGGSPADATLLALEMYKVTLAEHSHFTIPALSFRGTPFGIDARKVVAQGIEPLFNTGIAHRTPGIGQIGAGFGRAPLKCFRSALDAMSEGESS